MVARERRYLSFLLRLWCIRQNDCAIWRASLEDPHTGETRGFASLEALMEFLMEQIKWDEKDNPISEKPDKPP